MTYILELQLHLVIVYQHSFHFIFSISCAENYLHKLEKNNQVII